MSNIKENLQELYKNIIEDKIGSVAKVDDYGNVEFKIIKYGNFDIFIYENDPEYFRIRAGLDLSDNTELSEYDFLKLANEVNKNKKGVKVELDEYSNENIKYFKVTTEAFMAGPDALPEKKLIESVIERYVSAIQFALDEVSRRLDETIKELRSQKEQKMIAPPV